MSQAGIAGMRCAAADIFTADMFTFDMTTHLRYDILSPRGPITRDLRPSTTGALPLGGLATRRHPPKCNPTWLSTCGLRRRCT